MTKEEVAQVIAYCDENKISYKQRLAELGVNPWSFYDAKRKYAPKEDGENAGEFLQLVPGGSFLPNPIKPSRSRSSKQKDSAQGAVAVSIELRTPTGTMMRISGNLTGRELKDIIIASSQVYGVGKPACRYHPSEVLLSHAVLQGDPEVQGVGGQDQRLHDERLVRGDL